MFLGNFPPTPPLSQHYFSLRPKCLFRGGVGCISPEAYDPLGQWRLVKKTCLFLRNIHGQKFHTLLFLYQDVTKPRPPISPSGRSTDRRSSAGMSPVPRGPKVKEHLRQPFLTHNIFATHVVSRPEFWAVGGIAHPHFHCQSLVTERIRPTSFLAMQSHVSFKSWLLLLCKLSSCLKTFEVSVKGDAFTFLYYYSLLWWVLQLENWSKILLYLINLEDRHCSRVNFVLETRTLLKIRQLSLRNIKWGFL